MARFLSREGRLGALGVGLNFIGVGVADLGGGHLWSNLLAAALFAVGGGALAFDLWRFS